MRTARLAIAGVVAVLTAGAGFAVAGALDRVPEPPLGPGLVTVQLDIEHSRFSAREVAVRPGTTVRFVVANGDPIAHELVVGDEEVHARHRTGTEEAHPPVPGEVSVGPGETGVTVYRFDEPGAATFACHLPGHVAYGMVGQVVVTPVGA